MLLKEIMVFILRSIQKLPHAHPSLFAGVRFQDPPTKKRENSLIINPPAQETMF